MRDHPPATDAGLARWLAWRAGEILVALRAEIGHDDPRALGREGDRRAQQFLADELGRWRPADAVLSEEALDDPARLTADRVWIIDPLDGTREYSEPGRVDWAVHVGLWTYGRLSAGAVALPAQHRVLGTDSPPDYPPLVPSGNGGPPRLRMAVSRTRPPVFLDHLADALGGIDPVPMGSAGAKIVAVLDGLVDAYVHAGGQHEWDSAAPVAVANATGLHVSRLDGSTLEYNKADPQLPDLVVCRKDLAPRLLAALVDCR